MFWQPSCSHRGQHGPCPSTQQHLPLERGERQRRQEGRPGQDRAHSERVQSGSLWFRLTPHLRPLSLAGPQPRDEEHSPTAERNGSQSKAQTPHYAPTKTETFPLPDCNQRPQQKGRQEAWTSTTVAVTGGAGCHRACTGVATSPPPPNLRPLLTDSGNIPGARFRLKHQQA